MWWAQDAPGSDVEDYIADLIDQGWDEEAIAEERRQAEELMEPRYIWPTNWWVVQVFCQCSWTKQAGFNGLLWIGISAAEVRAAALMLRVPRKEWQDVLCGVQLMADAALPHLNTRKE